MKKFLKVIGLTLLLALIVPAAKAERLPIPGDKLPAQAQLFIKEYFPQQTVERAWAKMMRPTSEPMWYDVVLSNGVKINFSLDGNWYGISAKKSNQPLSIDFLPNAARKYITDNCKGQSVKSIKWKKDMYKVKMSDGQTLIFDKDYSFVKAKKAKKDKN